MSKTYEISTHRDACGNGTKTEIKQPKYFCKTCTKCIDKHCTVFKRYVEPDYNRCFNHSNYNPIAANFKPARNLEMKLKFKKVG